MAIFNMNIYGVLKIPATAISLDKSSINLDTVGQTEQITAILTPSDSTSKVSWTSSNTSIATVSSTGLVTCVTPGTCTITATTDNGLTAICGVTNGWKPGVHTYMYRPLLANANDGSGNSRNGTVNGTVTWNNGAVFAGSGQISSPLNSMPSNFTISCWVNKTQNSKSEQVLFAKWGSNTERGRFGMRYNNSGNLYVRNTPSESGSNWTLVGNYGYNTWHNVIYVKDGLTIKVYVDGSLATTVGYYQWDNYSSSYLGIGGWNANSKNFGGTIKDFIVEDVAWGATDALNYYNLTK